MNTYYLYINRDDLYRFLIENTIFPHPTNYLGRRTLSLALDNVLILCKERYNKESISKYCSDGFASPIVLEIEIDNSDIGVTSYENGELLIINNILSFNHVKRIHNVFEALPGFLFNDFYLFESLVCKELFECGNKEYNPVNIELSNIKNLENKIFAYSKIQAFYCTRFGFLIDQTISKKKVTFRRNIDLDSFKYVSNISYEEFIAEYFEKSKKSNKQIGLFDNETTYLNDNYEILIKNALNNNISSYSNDPYQYIYNVLFNYNYGDILYLFENNPLFNEALKNINSLENSQKNNIAFLRKYFDNFNDDRITITLFILSKIIDKDLENAKLYINNFFENSEFEKELLSMYGLARGMKKIDITIKQKPDILLFAYNKTKRFFDDNFKISSDDYYIQRDYTTSCILNDGFDFKVYDEKLETEYINKKIISFVKDRYGIAEKSIAKKIIKNLKPKELHELFIRIKKGEC